MLATIVMSILSVLTATHDVRAVAPGADGSLYVGTTGGLLRMASDGSERVLTPADGLPDGTVRCVVPDGDGFLVGTDRGVARVVGTRVVRAFFTGEPVYGIARADDGLWIGTWTGLLRTDEGGGGAEEVGDLERITDVARVGALLYVTTARRGVYVVQGDKVRRIRGDRFAWDIAVDGEDVWVATSGGLRRYRNGRPFGARAYRASRELSIMDLRAVTVEKGQPVVGSFGGGAHRFDGRRFVRVTGVPEGARVQAVLSVAKTLAVGTPEGLLVRDGAGKWTARQADGLPDNDLTSLARTREGLWVGTFHHGLALLCPNGRIERFDEARGLLDDRVNRLAVDAEGDLWVATDRGVVERRGGRFVLRGLLDRHVMVVAVAHGRVFAGAGDDLFEWDGAAFAPVADHPGKRLQDLRAGRDGSLLSGTAEGLAVGNVGGFTLLSSDTGALADDWITAVMPARGGVLLGTYSAGLMELRGGRARVLRDDLWVNAGAMAFLSGSLAVGTLDDGLWVRQGRAWRALRTGDGLPDDDVTAILPNGDGTAWVATRGGLVKLDLGSPSVAPGAE